MLTACVPMCMRHQCLQSVVQGCAVCSHAVRMVPPCYRQAWRGPEHINQDPCLTAAAWRAQLPSAEDVEFWVAPEKAGWLQSQGEHIKTWRRRWFVLKQGYLFRFGSQEVTSASKPRGLVDLSKARHRCWPHAQCWQLSSSRALHGLSLAAAGLAGANLAHYTWALAGAGLLHRSGRARCTARCRAARRAHGLS